MSAIQYFVLVPKDESPASYFQGYNIEIISPNFSRLLYAACHLPHNIAEIFFNQEQLIAFRSISPGRNIAIINCSLLDNFIDVARNCQIVILCLPSELKIAQDFYSKAHIKPIIISFASKKNIINLKDKAGEPTHLIDYELYKSLKGIVLSESSKEVQDEFIKKKIRKPYNAQLKNPSRAHGVTTPNEILIQSYGFKFNGRSIINSADNMFYQDAIISTANQFLLLSSQEMKEVVIYSPSIYSLLYDMKQNLWNQILRKTDKWHRDFIKSIVRNPNFSNGAIKIQKSEIDKCNPYEDEIAGPILVMRQGELKLTALAMSMLTTSEGIPSIRLPNAVNLHASLLREIEALSDDMKEESQKLLQEKFSELNSNLKSEIGSQFIDFITEKSNACKICSDAPIEWVFFENIPLMFSHEISKIPMTPGNMLLQLCGLGVKTTIQAAQLNDVLVIRSFNKDDDLKNLLEKAMQVFLKQHPLNVEIKDVTTIDEVVQALNEFKGNILIFDCHGKHDGQSGAGYLSIGNEDLNTWELVHKARIPPIVMLSACSTSAVAGSHASVANGLLRSGALSVIGTYLPVNGVKSSVFFARILFRISLFLKAIKSMGGETITWRTLISTFMRMSYITDVLMFFRGKALITQDQYLSIHLKSNFIINSFRPDWHACIFDLIAKEASKNPSDLMEMIKNECPLVETMFYNQIGRPDLIEIDL